MTELETTEPTKAELQDELAKLELPISGNKPELIERLAEAKADAVATDDEEADDVALDAAAVEAADLVHEDGEANVGSVVEYVDDARSDLGIFTTWLDGLVMVLADFEARTTNPAAAGMSAASKRIRDHADDVQRNVAGLTAACQALQNEAIAQAAVEDEEA